MQLALFISFAVLFEKDVDFYWSMLLLHFVSGIVMTLQNNVTVNSSIRMIGISFVVPAYIMTLSYFLPVIIYRNFNRPGYEDASKDFFLVIMEFCIIGGNILSSVLFMTLRSYFKESFLQEEWMHSQLPYYINLQNADHLDWDFQ